MAKLAIGKVSEYPVYAYFKVQEGWEGPREMIYDTGANISLLPSSYWKILGLDKYVPSSLEGVASDAKVPLRLTRITFRFIDLEGNFSPELNAWFGIAERDDVPHLLGLKDINITHRLVVDATNGIFRLEF